MGFQDSSSMSLHGILHSLQYITIRENMFFIKKIPVPFLICTKTIQNNANIFVKPSSNYMASISVSQALKFNTCKLGFYQTFQLNLLSIEIPM